MIHVETSAPQPARWHRRSTHRTLGAAAKAAARTEAACARIVVDARTIADLAGSDSIDATHMLEALQYRSREL